MKNLPLLMNIRLGPILLVTALCLALGGGLLLGVKPALTVGMFLYAITLMLLSVVCFVVEFLLSVYRFIRQWWGARHDV